MQVTLAPSWTSDPDAMQTYPVRAPQIHHSSHQGNFTNPHFSFPFHDHSFIHSLACIHTYIHSFIHSSIHSSHTSKHCICNCYITTLRITSRSGSRLIRYERRPTEVRRQAHGGLETALCQTERGEKNQDEHQRPFLTPLRSGQGHLDLSRLILTSSQAHRISIEGRPAGHLSHSSE